MDEVFKVTIAKGPSVPVLAGDDPSAGLARIWRPEWRQAVLVGDSHTDGLFADALQAGLAPLTETVLRLRFPAGESNKNRANKEVLEDAMLAGGCDRTCCLVAVGGGVTLDLAGFVAATYMRGVAHINVATSLLAQVDAAIGGKTGLNTAHGKNLIGAFHQPRAVLLHIPALRSLPPAEMKNGLAEMVKHAVLGDEQLFAELERCASHGTLIPPAPVVIRAARVKAGVVEQDERERDLRQVLNFGHTVAHGVERATDFQVPHGLAVAFGMRVEARLAAQLVGFPAADLERLDALLRGLDLPLAPPCDFASASAHFALDKKTRHQRLHCALPTAIGRMDDNGGRWARAVTGKQLQEAWLGCQA